MLRWPSPAPVVTDEKLPPTSSWPAGSGRARATSTSTRSLTGDEKAIVGSGPTLQYVDFEDIAARVRRGTYEVPPVFTRQYVSVETQDKPLPEDLKFYPLLNQPHLVYHVKQCLEALTSPFQVIRRVGVPYEATSGHDAPNLVPLRFGIDVEPQATSRRTSRDDMVEEGSTAPPSITVRDVEDEANLNKEFDLGRIQANAPIPRGRVVEEALPSPLHVLPLLLPTETKLDGTTEQLMAGRIPAVTKIEEEQQTAILVHIEALVTELQAKFGETEAFYCSLALYNIERQVKVSEMFYFQTDASGKVEHNGKAVFLISNRSPGIYLVLRVSRSLARVDDSNPEIYRNPEKVKFPVFISKTREAAARLGAYHQPLAWSYLRLFQPTGEVTQEKMRSLILARSGIPDGSIYDALREAEIPSTLFMNLKELVGYVKTYVREGMLLLEDGCAAKEVRELVSRAGSTLSIVNLLYLHLQDVDYSRFSPGGVSARNIVIECRLKDNDAELEGDGLAAVFPHYEGEMETFSRSHVLYHDKAPRLSDEVKVALPTELSGNHHILFTFYHVNCKPETGRKIAPEGESAASHEQRNKTLIGWAALPLLSDGRVSDGRKTLLVKTEPRHKDYLSSSNVDSSGATSASLPKFHVHVHSLSTLYPGDPFINEFFLALDGYDRKKGNEDAEQHLCSSMKRLGEKAPYDSVAPYLSVIFNQQLSWLCSSSERLRMTCLVSLLGLLWTSDDGASSSGGIATSRPGAVPYRNPRLSKFAEMEMGLCRSDKNTLHESLCQTWLALLEDDNTAEHLLSLSFRYSWFLFDVMVKSMTMCLAADDMLSEDANRSVRFCTSFYDLLESLCGSVARWACKSTQVQAHSVASDLFVYISLFLRDILGIADRGRVLKIIADVLEIMHEFQTQQSRNLSVVQLLPHDRIMCLARVDFLRVLADSEHLFALSLPCKYTVQPTTDLGERLCRAHFLGGLVVFEVCQLLDHKDTPVRKAAQFLIQDILLKHLADDRFQTAEYRENFAGVLFGYLVLVSESLHRCKTVAYAKIARLQDTHTKMKQRIDAYEKRIGEDTSLNEDNSLHTASITGDRDMAIGDPAMLEAHKEQLDILRVQLQKVEVEMQVEEMNFVREMQRVCGCFMFVLGHVRRTLLRDWWTKDVYSRKARFLSALAVCLEVFEYKGARVAAKDAEKALSDLETEMGIMGEVEPADFDLARRLFATDGEAESGMGRHSRSYARDCNQHISNIERLRMLKLQRLFDRTPEKAKEIRKRLKETERRVLLLTNLSASCSLSVLENMFDFVIDNEQELKAEKRLDDTVDEGPSILDRIVGVLHILLTSNQCEAITLRALEHLKYFQVTFRSVMFPYHSPHVPKLTKALLSHCISTFPSVREMATAALYLLIRSTFEEQRSIVEPKIQATVALSDLLRTIHDDKHLGRTIRALEYYAKHDTSQTKISTAASLRILKRGSGSGDKVAPPRFSTNFLDKMKLWESIAAKFSGPSTRGVAPKITAEDKERLKLEFVEHITDLCSTLNSLLGYTFQVRDLEKRGTNSELMADLLLRIATGYLHTPELRLIWLEHLATYQRRVLNSVESAVCMIDCAAFVSEYLVWRGALDASALPLGILREIAPHVTPQTIKDWLRVFKDNGESLWQSRAFSVEGFLHLLHSAIGDFEKAEYYEIAFDLYKLVVPLYEKSRKLQGLKNSYAHLQHLVEMMMDVNVADKRLLGTYYRVGFYGVGFGVALNGQEFVYKMPKVTQLSEVKESLEETFSDHFAAGSLETIKHKKNVDVSTLDPARGYMQITQVVPELVATRSGLDLTFLQKYTNYKRFMFETPFTEDGRVHGTMGEQLMRRTVLKVAHALPYMKTRVEVVGKEEIVLGPIEVAIELIAGQNKRLRREISSTPPNVNALQMVLQGSVKTQVNVGPKEVARTFLSRKDDDTFSQEHIRTLREKLAEFVHLCGEAIKLDRRIVDPDQMAFHEELELGFEETLHFFRPFLEEKPVCEVIEETTVLEGDDASSSSFSDVDASHRSDPRVV